MVAVAAVQEQIGMSLEDFILRYGEEPFELIDGEIVYMSPQVLRSSIIMKRLFLKLNQFVEDRQLGEVLTESPFVLKSSAKWVRGSRVPDVLFVTQVKMESLKKTDPEWDLSPLPFAPDLAVEVMSPTDRLSRAKKKAQRYLDDGVRLAWVIDPQRGAVLVYSPTGQSILGEEDILTGGEVLPEFSLEIADLFN